MTGSIQNEWMCLQIAKHFGLNVPNAEILQFDEIETLVVERFDRQWDHSEKLIRIPQEDMCQALGVPSSKKYQSNGGPGIVQIMEFLSASDTPSEDRMAFLHAQLVYFLLGATDGHAKNFSVFLKPNSGLRLTPFYDILTAYPALTKRQLERKEMKLAMSVGENHHYRVFEIRYRHWEQTAGAANVPKTELANLVSEVREKAEHLEQVMNNLPKTLDRELIEPTFDQIMKRVKILQ